MQKKNSSNDVKNIEQYAERKTQNVKNIFRTPYGSLLKKTLVLSLFNCTEFC